MQTDDPNTAFGDANYRAARRIGAPQGGHGALRSAHDQRQDLHGPGQGALRERGGRHQDPGCRQPGQHQLPDRDEQFAEDRSLAVHGDDQARSQPGRRAARRQARRARDRHQEDDDLGQPLGDAVPGPVPLRGVRQERRRAGQRPGVARERLHPDGPEARCRDHRSARPVERGVGGERRRRPHAHVGARHWRTATGRAWRCRPTAPTASPRASSPSFPATCTNGEWTVVQGLDIDDFSRGRIDASVAELADERDAVRELGLI